MEVRYRRGRRRIREHGDKGAMGSVNSVLGIGSEQTPNDRIPVQRMDDAMPKNISANVVKIRIALVAAAAAAVFSFGLAHSSSTVQAEDATAVPTPTTTATAHTDSTDPWHG